MNIIQLIGVLEMGLIYGFVAVGVYLTSRVINFPDLTVDGSFPLGAAIAAALIVNGINPWFATLLAFAGGICAGSVTGYLNVRWGILGLLAGILTMTGLYSINLRIMGKPNIALFNETTIFTGVDHILWILVGMIAVLIGLAIYFLNTEVGLALRATGVNQKICRAQGIPVNWMIILGLALSNGIVALAGALYAQVEGYADITLGAGTIVIGLASVIIGEMIFRTKRISILILSCIFGSIIYRLALAFALNIEGIGLKSTDLKLITALLIALAMILPKLKNQIVAKRKS